MTKSATTIWCGVRLAIMGVALVPGIPFTASAQTGALSSMTVSNLSPVFSPAVTQYTIPRTSACSVQVAATLTTATHRLYIASSETPSGVPRNVWVCDGVTKLSLVVYQNWTEKGRYTITLVHPPPAPAPGPTPPPTPGPTPPPPPPPPPAFELPPDPSPIPPIPTATLPQATPTDGVTAERVLQQATFGPSAAEFAAVKAKGVHLWLAEQFRKPAGGLPDGLNNNQIRSQVFMKMANGQDQLRQRMAFALSQTLAVSMNKLVNGYEVIPYVRLLENHAFGNYRTLLREITISPSMGKYLDLANSDASNGMAPNENYPRELMQLFSIGLYTLNMNGTYTLDGQGHPIPTYDQTLLRAVARALSGWTYPTQPGFTPASRNPEYFVGVMEPRPTRHHQGAKTLFNGITLPAGQTVTKDMEDLVDVVFNHPNVAPFVATRLIRSLVTSNPSGAYIQRVANVFANNGDGVRGDLAAVLTAILTDPDATLGGANDGRLRDPILHVIGFSRAMGLQVASPDQFMYVLSQLGQSVLSPISVFSFYSPLGPLPGDPTRFGPEFQLYTPALSIQRATFIYRILYGDFSSSFPVNLTPFTAVAANPAALVELVNQTLLFGRMSQELRQVLLASAQATSDLKQRAIGALYLAAISSEFVVHSGAQ